MKFITEEELRDLYKIQPFTDYDLPEGERLTPGARQFLLDRGIDLYDRNDPFASLNNERSAGGVQNNAKPVCDRKKRILDRKLKSIQTSFLLTVKELMETDPCMAQQLTMLSRQYSGFRELPEGICPVSDLCCNACTGIRPENFGDYLGDCFEITEFHINLPKGKQMLILDRLKTELQLFVTELPDLLGDRKLQEDVSCKLNQIINTISQMICLAMGEKVCQRRE